MNAFVTQIIDGDTFEIKECWTWNNQTGNRVRLTGYNAPEAGTIAGDKATEKLRKLIKGKEVEIKSAKTIDRGRLVCDVYFQGKNLADYFPEYKV
jgi:endonuclease YncB( thermonuclease family)